MTEHALDRFEPLIGSWHGEGDMPTDPPVKIRVDATIERMGDFLVMRSTGEPVEMPSTLAVIGGASDGEPQPMHYFDSRGVKRLFLMTLEQSTWTIVRAPGEDWNGPDGPGFNQRFIGELSPDGRMITGRWERGEGEAGDHWVLDFPLTYVRT
jgi:hypothetical protein